MSPVVVPRTSSILGSRLCRNWTYQSGDLLDGLDTANESQVCSCMGRQDSRQGEPSCPDDNGSARSMSRAISDIGVVPGDHQLGGSPDAARQSHPLVAEIKQALDPLAK